MFTPAPISEQKVARLLRSHRSDRRARAVASDAAWLAQFSPVDARDLSERQRKFRETLQTQYPEGRIGRRVDGPLCFYAIDSAFGRFTGLLPEQL